MARRPPPAAVQRSTVRLFAHPQRGAVLFKEPMSPEYRSYLGGRDSDWEQIALVEMVAVGAFWRPAPGQRPPAGFLWGEPERQSFGMSGPHLVFGPMEQVCRDCKDDFVLTAREQKHLYETVRAFIDARIVSCRACRRARGALERARAAYADALRAVERTPSATAHLDVAKAALEVAVAGGRVSLDKALGHCRRARKLGAGAAAERVERQLVARRAAR